MKKLVLMPVILLLAVSVTVSCKKKKDAAEGDVSNINSQNAVADSRTATWVADTNAELAKIPVAGFGYKSAKLPSTSWREWKQIGTSPVKAALKDIPSGYVLQVTGHADASGPEEPTGPKPGNIRISTDRARTVYDALKSAGISSQRLIYKGTGATQLIDGVDPRSPKQRRVTFEIVPE